MTAQPSQETVKPETIEFAEQLYVLGWDSPTDAQWRKLDGFLPAYTQRIEAAATQKLEAEKAELQRENVMLREIIASTFGVLHGSPAIKGTENEASVIVAQRSLTYITQLRSQLDGMTKALTEIKSYGKDGICPYGCDCPDIAGRALAALTTQPQPVADGPAGFSDRERLDWLEGRRLQLNKHNGSDYGWEIVLSHLVTRLMVKGVNVIDVNDAAANKGNIRAAIDEAIRAQRNGGPSS